MKISIQTDLETAKSVIDELVNTWWRPTTRAFLVSMKEQVKRIEEEIVESQDQEDEYACDYPTTTVSGLERTRPARLLAAARWIAKRSLEHLSRRNGSSHDRNSH